MKKILLAAAVAALISSSAALAGAGEQTLSLGYSRIGSDGLDRAYSELKKQASPRDWSTDGDSSHDGSDDPDGVFFKYRYEFNEVWGVIGSFTYAGKDYSFKSISRGSGDTLNQKYKLQSNYVSLMMGPSLRVNEYFSLYALAGAAYKNIKSTVHASYDVGGQSGYGNGSKTNDRTDVAYSAGVQFNVYKGFVVDASYEGTAGGSNWRTDGFTIGIGYKF
jgi:opacity protein-like surface antigen